jgi:hypothetical protein
MKAELRVALHQVQSRLVTRLVGSRKTALRNGSKNYVRFVKLCLKYIIILTLDGYYSHLKNIEVIDCARENGA